MLYRWRILLRTKTKVIISGFVTDIWTNLNPNQIVFALELLSSMYQVVLPAGSSLFVGLEFGALSGTYILND